MTLAAVPKSTASAATQGDGGGRRGTRPRCERQVDAGGAQRHRQEGGPDGRAAGADRRAPGRRRGRAAGPTRAPPGRCSGAVSGVAASDAGHHGDQRRSRPRTGSIATGTVQSRSPSAMASASGPVAGDRVTDPVPDPPGRPGGQQREQEGRGRDRHALRPGPRTRGPSASRAPRPRGRRGAPRGRRRRSGTSRPRRAARHTTSVEPGGERRRPASASSTSGRRCRGSTGPSVTARSGPASSEVMARPSSPGAARVRRCHAGVRAGSRAPVPLTAP